jgi:Prolyl oligopeptidase family
MPNRWLPPLVFLGLTLIARADGPADNRIDNVRPVPPPGIGISDADRKALEDGVAELGKQIDGLRDSLKAKPALLTLLPDVQIYDKAVRWALIHNEFYEAREVAVAKKLLAQGLARADSLRAGNAPWNTATGLVVRGYVSKIDGSVQPYGLVVPASFQANTPHRFRLDVWCHGRGEKLSELSFMSGRQSSRGEFTPADAFVVHPYGRYCNANKFAGEIDLFEAIEDIKKRYPIDDDRVVMRGFSMGGAACWQFAVHYPSTWVAAAPGAGFSETADFLKVFQNESAQPPWYEQKLWHLYDCTDYALNLFNCPTVAYSGEVDRQKQAADMMARALAKEGIELVHVIGAKAPHRYTPEAKDEINRRIDSIVKVGRDPVPVKVRFTTWTLRYNRSFWVQVDGMQKHWEQARVDADLFGRDGLGPEIITKNVSALTLTMPPGYYPADLHTKPSMTIDGEKVDGAGALSDRSWTAHFRKVDSHWQPVDSEDDGKLRKRHGLQGPIDDAFMDSFLMVRPTGTALNEKVGGWAKAELQHALDHWRRQFRGEARIKDDADITEADIAANHLILWGDPSSNSVLAKISGKLPIQWTEDAIRAGGATYAAGHHVPVLIYPNPLNPKRYVVVNSGFTFREYDYLNNARQVPKLPDFAVVDIDVPVSSRAPGGIAAAGFFDEEWGIPASK